MRNRFLNAAGLSIALNVLTLLVPQIANATPYVGWTQAGLQSSSLLKIAACGGGDATIRLYGLFSGGVTMINDSYGDPAHWVASGIPANTSIVDIDCDHNGITARYSDNTIHRTQWQIPFCYLGHCSGGTTWNPTGVRTLVAGASDYASYEDQTTSNVYWLTTSGDRTTLYIAANAGPWQALDGHLNGWHNCGGCDGAIPVDAIAARTVADSSVTWDFTLWEMLDSQAFNLGFSPDMVGEVYRSNFMNQQPYNYTWSPLNPGNEAGVIAVSIGFTPDLRTPPSGAVGVFFLDSNHYIWWGSLYT